MKVKKKKASHSFFSNLAFMFKIISRRDKALVPLNMTFDVFSAIGSLAVASFSTVLTYCFENGKSFQFTVAAVSGIVILQLVNAISQNVMWQSIESRRADVGRHFEVLLGHKLMNMDFFLIEGPLGREKYQKAKNALCEEGVHGFLEQYGRLFTYILLTVIYSSVTAFLNPWLILILTALEALKLISAGLENKLIGKTKDPIAKADRRINYLNRVSRDFSFAKDIRLFHMREYLTKLCEEYIIARKRLTEKMYFYNITLYAINLLTYIFVAAKIYIGSVSLGALFKYHYCISRIVQSTLDLANVIAMIKANNDFLELFFEYTDLPTEMHYGTIPTEKRADNKYDIEFHDVSFKYPGSDTYALKNISFKFKVGESIAVVGQNGSGKTTLIKLLCRLYDPKEGYITLNGIDIKKYNYEEYLALFGTVFQDFRLFSLSVGENVAASGSFESKRVEKALETAGLLERVNNMPKKLDTSINKDFDEDGVEISGGEAQKLAIARALYKDAPFVILDEPTAALDPLAEYEIYSRFNEMVKNKTAVYISHRLSSCIFCDKIAVFSEGALTQFGTHESLLKDKKGKYHALWNAQAKYYTEKSASSEVG